MEHCPFIKFELFNDLNTLVDRLKKGHITRRAILISSGGLCYDVIDNILEDVNLKYLIRYFVIYCGNLEYWRKNERAMHYTNGFIVNEY